MSMGVPGERPFFVDFRVLCHSSNHISRRSIKYSTESVHATSEIKLGAKFTEAPFPTSILSVVTIFSKKDYDISAISPKAHTSSLGEKLELISDGMPLAFLFTRLLLLGYRESNNNEFLLYY